MPVEGLSINLATVRQQWTLDKAVDACLAKGIMAIAPWRDQVEKIGLAEAVQVVRSNGMRVGGLPKGSRDIMAARDMVADGIAAILPHARANNMPLAIEPLHPMYAADRA